MGYIDNSLLEGESVVFKTRRHKIVFLWPMIWLLAGFGTLIGSYFIDEDIWVFSVVFVVVALIHGGILWLEYITSEFGVTNQRVIIKEGFIKRKTMEVFLKRIESVQVDQSVMGRILDFGIVVVAGTGGAQDPFEKIRNPLEFKKQIQQQLAKV